MSRSAFVLVAAVLGAALLASQAQASDGVAGQQDRPVFRFATPDQPAEIRLVQGGGRYYTYRPYSNSSAYPYLYAPSPYPYGYYRGYASGGPYQVYSYPHGYASGRSFYYSFPQPGGYRYIYPTVPRYGYRY